MEEVKWYEQLTYGEDTCLANDLIVNAWRELPERYTSE